MNIPKHIEKKIDRLEKLLIQAHEIKHEIESWAETKGADTMDGAWHQTAVNDCMAVSGISLEGMEEYFESLEGNREIDMEKFDEFLEMLAENAD